MKRLFAVVLLAVSILSVSVMAHDHTSIGLNSDGITGTADDNQLWIFAEPDEPQWDVIDLLPTGDHIGGRQIYKAELDCWHSAEDVSYMLGNAADETMVPAWKISLQRVSFSSKRFWMESEATGQEVLAADGDLFALTSIWMDDEYNANGQLGVWGIHSHTEFIALADGTGETFTASFNVVDLGTTGYLVSDVYTMTFQAIPEPMTIALLGLGALSVIRRRQ